ncbi:MAG: hypothetical protein HQM12_07715 [SAR324 cluster bacterium]|nr:hypothetical protein [SAR324 cluster bacterium]
MGKSIIICVDDEQVVLNELNKQLRTRFKDLIDFEEAESAEVAKKLIQSLHEDGEEILSESPGRKRNRGHFVL